MSQLLKLNALLKPIPKPAHGTFINMLRHAIQEGTLAGLWGGSPEEPECLLRSTPETQAWLDDATEQLKDALTKPRDPLRIPMELIDTVLFDALLAKRGHSSKAEPPVPNTQNTQRESRQKRNKADTNKQTEDKRPAEPPQPTDPPQTTDPPQPPFNPQPAVIQASNEPAA